MPSRASGLWPRLTSFANLLLAHRKARRGKRGRPEVAAFEYDLEANLLSLQRELLARTYAPGPYRAFTIREPKARLISAAPYRDRVVHHALMSVLEPVVDARLAHDCYACRRGKGSHSALDRYTQYARRFPYVWHGDIRKFFPSLDHEILKGLLARMVKDSAVLWLAGRIIDASNPLEEVQAWFPGDNLFTPLERRRGLPIGNLTSQWFANLYLGPFDLYVKQALGAPGYVRCCDDFCLFGERKAVLAGWMLACADFLARRLRLELNPKRRQIVPVACGITFLGLRVFPEHRRIAAAGLARSVRRLKGRVHREGLSLDRKGRIPVALPWIAHVAHADTWGLRGRVLRRLPARERRDRRY